MSKTNDIDMSALDPAAEPGAGASKALRADPKGEGDAPVFRLDSLAPGAGQDGAAPIPTPSGSRISQAAIFFAVLIVVGGGLLYAMRKIGINPMSAIAKMNDPEVDLSRNGQSRVDHNRVLRDLSESAVKGQVPPEEVQKNPFEIPEVVQAAAADEPDLDAKRAAEKSRKDAEARKQKISSTLAGLRVHSIINGSNPVARINDEAVRVGDTVEQFFTVKAIHGRGVDLECDGQLYTVTLDDESVRQPSRKKK